MLKNIYQKEYLQKLVKKRNTSIYSQILKEQIEDYKNSCK